jgi:hypothetical protein
MAQADRRDLLDAAPCERSVLRGHHPDTDETVGVIGASYRFPLLTGPQRSSGSAGGNQSSSNSRIGETTCTSPSSAALSSKRRAAAVDHAEYLPADNDGSGLAPDLD